MHGKWLANYFEGVAQKIAEETAKDVYSEHEFFAPYPYIIFRPNDDSNNFVFEYIEPDNNKPIRISIPMSSVLSWIQKNG